MSSFGETAGSTMDRLNKLLSSIHSSPLDDSREIKLHLTRDEEELMTESEYNKEKDPLLQYFGKLKTNLMPPPNSLISPSAVGATSEQSKELKMHNKLHEERSRRIRQLLDANDSETSSKEPNGRTARITPTDTPLNKQKGHLLKVSSFDERIANISRRFHQQDDPQKVKEPHNQNRQSKQSFVNSPPSQKDSLSSRIAGIKISGISNQQQDSTHHSIEQQQGWGRQLSEALERSPKDRTVPLSTRINSIKLNGISPDSNNDDDNNVDQPEQSWGRQLAESLERSPSGGGQKANSPDGYSRLSKSLGRSPDRSPSKETRSLSRPAIPPQGSPTGLPSRSDTPTEAFINMLRSSSSETAKPHQQHQLQGKQSGLDSLLQSLQQDVNKKNDDDGRRSHSQSANRLLADIQNDQTKRHSDPNKNEIRYVSRLSNNATDSRTRTPAPIRSSTFDDIQTSNKQPAPPERSATAPSPYNAIPMFSDLVNHRSKSNNNTNTSDKNKEGEGFTALLHKLHDEENRSGTAPGLEVVDVNWSDLAEKPTGDVKRGLGNEFSTRERYAGSPVECSPASAQDCEGLTALLEKLHKEEEEEELNADHQKFLTPGSRRNKMEPSSPEINEQIDGSPSEKYSSRERVLQWGHRMEHNMQQREANRLRRMTEKELQDEADCPFKPKINKYYNSNKVTPSDAIEKRTASILRAKEQRLELQRRDQQKEDHNSQPVITNRAKQMTRNNGSRLQWDAFRKIKIEQQQAGQEQQELQACTFQPSLSERSRSIAKRKELRDKRVPSITTPNSNSTPKATFTSTPKTSIRTPLQHATPSNMNSASNRPRSTVGDVVRKPNPMPKRTPSSVSAHQKPAAAHLSADDWWNQAIRVQRSELGMP